MQELIRYVLIYFDTQLDFWIVTYKLINRYYFSCFLRVSLTLSSLSFCLDIDE